MALKNTRNDTLILSLALKTFYLFLGGLGSDIAKDSGGLPPVPAYSEEGVKCSSRSKTSVSTSGGGSWRMGSRSLSRLTDKKKKEA